jgi:putative metalloenzyme radical SAM/SPASM domain maturase
MCVKQTKTCGIAEGNMALSTFEALESALPHIETLILNGIGETLLHQNLETFIRTAKKLMPENSSIGFQTNGLLLDDQKAQKLLAAGLNKICISIDAITPEKLERLREGANISGLGKALKSMLKAKKLLNMPDVKIGVEIVAMRSNLSEIPATLEWAATHGATFALVTNVLPYTAEYIDEAVYEPCSREAIALLDKWRSQAAREGVDINRYPSLLTAWYLSPNDEDQKVLDFIEKLRAEAEQKNIFLDLKKLFSLDHSEVEEAAVIFSKAEEVAKKNNLELSLPQLLLEEDRRCDFIEEGSAFISWDGNVHPCYFLWHSYQCFASGWQQQVQPKVFGNLNQNSMLEIWNSNEFRKFRKNVTRYDYPYCSSCGLAPCDYIQTEHFEQDCHISEEPCGSCLWCMGLFQCLR